MAFQPGDDIEADRLNRLASVPYFAQASSTLTATTTTYADIPGATVTFTTTAPNARYVVWGVFDCRVSVVSSGTRMLGRIVTDGVAEAGFAIHQMVALDADTDTTMASGTLANAGSHTIKLQGALSAASGTGVFQVFTQVMVLVMEVA